MIDAILANPCAINKENLFLGTWSKSRDRFVSRRRSWRCIHSTQICITVLVQYHSMSCHAGLSFELRSSRLFCISHIFRLKLLFSFCFYFHFGYLDLKRRQITWLGREIRQILISKNSRTSRGYPVVQNQMLLKGTLNSISKYWKWLILPRFSILSMHFSAVHCTIMGYVSSLVPENSEQHTVHFNALQFYWLTVSTFNSERFWSSNDKKIESLLLRMVSVACTWCESNLNFITLILDLLSFD